MRLCHPLQLECHADLSYLLDAAEGRTAAVSYLLQPAVITNGHWVQFKTSHFDRF